MNLVPIQITIQAANASDLRALVADLAGTIATMAPANIPAETTVSTVSEPDRNKEEKLRSEIAAAQAEKARREAAQKEAEKQMAAATESVPTDVELRALAAEKAKSAGKAAVKALLEKYESASITAVPVELRSAFKMELEAL